MLKETITYKDYNGIERTENFYFNLTKAELMEMELGTSGGMTEYMNKIIEAQDGPSIMKVFKDIVFKAYGEKSADGRRFIKSKELSEEFSQTEAYDQLFMKLISNADAMAAFVNGLIPSDLREEANKTIAKEKK